ncbi:MAG: homoserine O-succinyltransferase [Gammaproteobacteria bacterium]|nr:homoserine O-succinyltransferase [Gammaproteobacteria bacterium]
MPLVEHVQLPTFSRLREQGHEVLPLDRAVHQDIRELHIGFLNMMPDAALEATERQFIRLVGNCNRIAQFYVYPFSLPGLSRSDKTLDYIEQFYCKFEDLQEQGLDALIITGANVANPNLEEEPFWEPLMEVVRWANQNVASTLCSCLATHALLKYLHGIERQPLPQKRWGVYSHRISRPGHPLLRGINTRFDVPHSRYNEISRQQLEDAGLTILVESSDGGVHMAVSEDQFRLIYFQGHPEYDVNSLLKEYKRELVRYLNGELHTPPPYPEHYFSTEAESLARQILEQAMQAQVGAQPSSSLLEEQLEPMLDNTWGDTAKAVVNNWLGLVYQVTNLDRTKQFMEDVDPTDPLRLKN